ncbi:MAG TPA: hypothetical protein VGX93_06305 [Chthoniobacterales bacterium]|jgi:hypothetical protein|nr:hypothetical protein [Chthoniobacterales bacterium]
MKRQNEEAKAGAFAYGAISVVGTDARSESTASRAEIVIVWMPINDIHRPAGRRLILQLLNSGNS